MEKLGATRSVVMLLAVAWTMALGPSNRAELRTPARFRFTKDVTKCRARAFTPRLCAVSTIANTVGCRWNTWDVHSVTTQVLLPDGLAIHMSLKHNSTLYGDAFLGDALIGRLTPDAEQVFPGPHSWEGSYTDLRLSWKGHELRLQTAHNGSNLVMLATPASVTAAVRTPGDHRLFCELSLGPYWKCDQGV